MTNGRDFDKIVETAREHYKAVKSDIANAKDRIEHIRLTALAQSAYNLLTELIELQTGINSPAEEQSPLDIPDFKSPYDPRNLVD